MAVDLTNKIHGDFSTGSGVWMGYRGDITGAYITEEGTGANYVTYSNKLIREYNEKINELTQPKSLYIEPNDAGFRYTNKPLLGTYNGAAGAYSTRTVGFGGYLMKVRNDWDINSSQEADVRGDINGEISLNSPVEPTGAGIPDYTYALGNSLGTGSQLGPYEVVTFQTGVLGKQYKITYVKDAWYEDLSGYATTYGRNAVSYWEGAGGHVGRWALNGVHNAPNGDSLRYAWRMLYVGFASAWIVDTTWSADGESTSDTVYYMFESEATAAGSTAAANALNYVVKIEAVHDTLANWVGTATGYVSTWYDQSHTGSAQNNLTQTTAADQPIIVNGGTLQTDSSGTAALDFNGSTHHMTLNTGFSSTINISGLSSYTVFEADTTGANQMVACLGSFADSTKRWYCPYIFNGAFSMNYGGSAAFSTTANTNLTLLSITADQTQGAMRGFVNGSQVGGNGTLENKGGGTALVGVGGLGDSLHFNGKVDEFIFYSGQSVSTNRESIESNINKHFKIY